MPKRHDAQIALRLPAEVVEQLRQEAAADDRSMSAVVRRIIDRSLGDHRDDREKVTA